MGEFLNPKRTRRTYENSLRWQRSLGRLTQGHAWRFLLVGIASFVLDLGLLIVLHEVFKVHLWVATPIAFLVSLVFNFILQRVFTFKATNSHRTSIVKYLVLVVFNTLATDFIVAGFEQIGIGYEIGKVFSTGLTMVWNYFVYKYWIFAGVSSAKQKPVAMVSARP